MRRAQAPSLLLVHYAHARFVCVSFIGRRTLCRFKTLENSPQRLSAGLLVASDLEKLET